MKKVLLTLLSLVLTAQFASAALTDSLVLYFRLEDATAASGGVNLTPTGGPVYNKGKIDNGVDFGNPNTTKNLYRTPSFFSYADIGTGWTFSYWINISATSASSFVTRYIMNNGSLERSITMYVDNNSKINLSTFDSTSRNIASTSTLSLNTWYHIAGQYRSGTMYLYVNCIQDGTPLTYAWSGFARTTFSDFSIGAEQNTAGGALGNYFSGKVDELGAWNRGLSQTELCELYNVGGGNQFPFIKPFFWFMFFSQSQEMGMPSYYKWQIIKKDVYIA